jgi:hypothetical protein
MLVAAPESPVYQERSRRGGQIATTSILCVPKISPMALTSRVAVSAGQP